MQLESTNETPLSSLHLLIFRADPQTVTVLSMSRDGWPDGGEDLSRAVPPRRVVENWWSENTLDLLKCGEN